jgi:outer membrane protein, heavy metal efflux system
MPIRIAGALLICGLAACATVDQTTQTDVIKDIRAVTGADVRFEAPSFSLPVGVIHDDGLSREEAVAIALWNNAAFQATLSDLGFARADLADAGVISNPALSLLFPVGPKQLEATLRWPIEVLWERPKRLAAAERRLESVAQSLMQSGLDLVLAVRLGYADLTLMRDRERLAHEAAGVFQEIDRLTQSRLAAGDIAELDARIARVDAVRRAQEAARAGHDVTIARARLALLLGLQGDDVLLSRLSSEAEPSPCGAVADLLRHARAARPDLRAAELSVEAAAARLGWERSRILTLTAVLDANGEGRAGFEAGPGIDVSIPIFNRNQGGRLRGQSELQRAAAVLVQLRRQIETDVREAAAQFDQAHESRAAWRDTIVTPLRDNLADAEASFATGESSFLFVLENGRQLIDARVREREIAADEQRARARVERAVGYGCPASPGETN